MKSKFAICICLITVFLSTPLYAADIYAVNIFKPLLNVEGRIGQFLEGGTVQFLSVNGGSDTPNPGVSCVQISNANKTQCEGGWFAIPNNNKEILAGALTAKAVKSNVWVYYFDDEINDNTPLNHCPGITFTRCRINSFGLK